MKEKYYLVELDCRLEKKTRDSLGKGGQKKNMAYPFNFYY